MARRGSWSLLQHHKVTILQNSRWDTLLERESTRTGKCPLPLQCCVGRAIDANCHTVWFQQPWVGIEPEPYNFILLSTQIANGTRLRIEQKCDKKCLWKKLFSPPWSLGCSVLFNTFRSGIWGKMHCRIQKTSSNERHITTCLSLDNVGVFRKQFSWQNLRVSRETLESWRL